MAHHELVTESHGRCAWPDAAWWEGNFQQATGEHFLNGFISHHPYSNYTYLFSSLLGSSRINDTIQVRLPVPWNAATMYMCA
jgi:hypothetical protein